MVAVVSSTNERAQEEGALTLADIKARPVWVCFRIVERNGQRTKPPFNPLTGRLGKPGDPRTWATYKQAVAACADPGSHYDGIGFQFHPDWLPLVGIDLDHCVDPRTGQLARWAQEIVTALDSYTEISPSGTGVHILLVGNGESLTHHKVLVRALTQDCHAEARIEIYTCGRYFTLTEQMLPGSPTDILPRQRQLETVYERLTAGRSAPAVDRHNQQPPASALDLTDQDLITRALEAQNGADFRQLWQGNLGESADASQADFSLCLSLAFWTGKNAARMDRLFRRSGLYREKWNERRGSSTYGEMTIARAIDTCANVYTQKSIAAIRTEREVARILTERQGADEWGRRPFRLEPKEISHQRVLECLNFNELGDAFLFVEAFEGQVLFDATEKNWYLWAGHHWRRDRINQVRQLLSGHVGAIYIKTAAHLNEKIAGLMTQIESAGALSEEADQLKGKQKDLELQMKALNERAKALRGAKRCLNVLNTYVASDNRMAVTGEQWDANPWLLATPEGVLDLRTGQLHPGQPDEYIRTVAPTTWRGLAEPCPRFQQFLQEIFADRPDDERAELIAFLQRLLGYAITGRTDDHIFPILQGEEGRNGKDTLLAVLKSILGPLAGAVSNDLFLAADKGRTGGSATPHIVDLQGRRLVWGSETKQGAVFNVAQIKLLTGGGEISARPLYGEQFTFRPSHKLFLLTNPRPHADAHDRAFWTRACLIEFRLSFVEKPEKANERPADTKLREALETEASGILAWLVRGCLHWQEMGLARPESVRIATENYRAEEDQLESFLRTCCTDDNSATINANELYTAYREWCQENTLSTMSSTLFGREIGKRYKKKRTSKGFCYGGIRLRDVSDPWEETSSVGAGTGGGRTPEGESTTSLPAPSPVPAGCHNEVPAEGKEEEPSPNTSERTPVREQFLAYGQASGWPRLPLSPSSAVAAGEASWRTYATLHTLGEIVHALGMIEGGGGGLSYPGV